MVMRMLLTRVAASMHGEASAEQRTNGCAERTGGLAAMPLASGDGTSDEAEVGAAAPVRELDAGFPAAVPGLSLWAGLAAVRDSLGGATKKYHTTPATAQASNIAGSHFLIRALQANMAARRAELGGQPCSRLARYRFI